MFFNNVLFYRLTQTLPITSSGGELEAALATRPHREPSTQELSACGFVPALAGESTALTHGAANAFLVRMRTSTRDLKGVVVNRELKARVDAIEKAQLRKVYKKERDLLKDEIIQALLPRAFVTDKDTLAYIDLQRGLVVVNAASHKAAENLLSLLRECLGSLPVRPVTVKIFPQATMTSWVKSGEAQAGTGFRLLDNCELVDTHEGGGVVRCKRQDLAGDEVQAHMSAGKLCTSLSLAWTDKLSFDLDERLVIRRLRFEDLLRDQAEQDGGDDALAQLDASFVIMVGTLRDFFDALVTALGGEEVPGDPAVLTGDGSGTALPPIGDGIDVTAALGLAGSGITATLVVPGTLEQTAAEDGDWLERDPLYAEAVDFVRSSRRASISAVQRKFKIGYNRGARLIDALEAAGVVTAMNSSGSREVIG